MRKNFIAAILTGLINTTISSQLALAGKQDFVLANATGYQIGQVFISPSSAEDWHEDILGKGTLDTGNSVKINFDRSGAVCKWDIKVVYSEDNTYAIWPGINLCVISHITLYYNKKFNTTSAITDAEGAQTNTPVITSPNDGDQAVSLVRSYYNEYLNQADVASATMMWLKPPKNLAALVRNSAYAQVSDIEILAINNYSALLRAKTIGQKRGARPEYWQLEIDLVKVAGEWKISRMHNAKRWIQH